MLPMWCNVACHANALTFCFIICSNRCNSPPLLIAHKKQDGLRYADVCVFVHCRCQMSHLPTGKWNAQWMQNPTAEEGAILKREWWMKYDEDIPQLHHVIQSYDTAFYKKGNSRLFCNHHMGYILSR